MKFLIVYSSCIVCYAISILSSLTKFLTYVKKEVYKCTLLFFNLFLLENY
jgi:hypothetical protein